MFSVGGGLDMSDEELTDDEIYLERHEKAFSDGQRQKSITFNKKK